MILDNFSFTDTDPLCEFAHDFCNCDDIGGNPFEYIIRSIYENQMIIADMNLQIMAEEYTYLKKYGEEPVFIGEGGIISTIFGGLFKLLANAFKAICSFFKNIFSKNKSTIESTSKDIKANTDKSSTSDKQKTQSNINTSSKASASSSSVEKGSPIIIRQINTNNSSSSNSKTSPKSQNNSELAKNKTSNSEDYQKIWHDLCITASKNPSKYGLNENDVIIDPSRTQKSILTFANEYANIIINTVNDMSSDIRSRYETLITVYDDDLQLYDYMHQKSDAQNYLKTHPRDLDNNVKAFDSLEKERGLEHYGDWVKKHITEVMINRIPEYVRQSDIKEMYHQYIGDDCVTKMTEYTNVNALLTGKNKYIKLTNLPFNNTANQDKNAIQVNTTELNKLNEQCVTIFANAKAVIVRAEKDLKSIQQIASGAENRIKMAAQPNSTINVGTISGRKGNDAKQVLVKYFNSLSQSITFLISQATTVNAQTSASFAKLISHCISVNANTCKKMAKFVNDVSLDAFGDWFDNSGPIVL